MLMMGQDDSKKPQMVRAAEVQCERVNAEEEVLAAMDTAANRVGLQVCLNRGARNYVVSRVMVRHRCLGFVQPKSLFNQERLAVITRLKVACWSFVLMSSGEVFVGAINFLCSLRFIVETDANAVITNFCIDGCFESRLRTSTPWQRRWDKQRRC